MEGFFRRGMRKNPCGEGGCSTPGHWNRFDAPVEEYHAFFDKIPLIRCFFLWL